jgi:hypothetical protein
VSGSKNLIMGYCAKLPFRRLEPFIASLRNAKFAGDVCLHVQDIAAETIERLRPHGIIVERAGPSAQPSMSVMSSRYFSYQDFLLGKGEPYANVLLTDPSTTVFQADPFANPLPADIVYTAERRRIGDTPPVHDAVVQAYGEAVAHNIRDCTVSNPDITIGTRSGMLRYLAAMAHQFAGRTTPITGTIDQGVHNYVVHMRPLRGAWLDTTDRIAAALNALPDNAVGTEGQGVIIGGHAVPVLSRWDANAKAAEYIRASPRIQLNDSMLGAWPAPVNAPPPLASEPQPAATDAVVAFYLRERDAGWLDGFLGSLRCVSESIAVHCVGDFDQDDQAILARYRCIAYRVPATEPELAENNAHFYLSQILDRLSSDGAVRLDQVLVIDNMRAVFPRDPFLTKTIGLSVFCEGPTRIAESDFNRARVGFFASPDQRWLRSPVVSSMILRGPLPLAREFYRRMFIELVGRAELLKIQKVVQGLVNRLCLSGELGFPVIAHPNGAEVHFDFLECRLAVDTRYGLRIGGAVPGVVLASHRETPLMLKLRVDLNLPDI